MAIEETGKYICFQPQLKPEHTNKSYGILAYVSMARKMNQEFPEHTIVSTNVLTSEKKTGGGGRRLWESLVRQGFATYDEKEDSFTMKKL